MISVLPTVTPTAVRMLRELPMAQPQCHANGWITYTCPLGCRWHFLMRTPPMDRLDWHLKTSRETLTHHYKTSHGVIRD